MICKECGAKCSDDFPICWPCYNNTFPVLPRDCKECIQINDICGPCAELFSRTNGEQTGGLKHDTDKPDLSMISYEMVEAVARVRMFGAKKYSRNNWKKGFKVSRSCAAALRHIFLFLSGETNDSESGLSHLAHAICCLEHALYDMVHHPQNDDRGDA